MKIAPLILLLALILPATASAEITTDAQRIVAFTPVAAKTFPSACVGHVVLAIVDADDVPGETPGLLRDGAAYPDGSCRIFIRAGLSNVRFCTTLVHEYGHLAGIIEHTPTGIMSEHGDDDFQPCWDAVNAAVTDLDRIRQILPTYTSAKKIRKGTRTYRRGTRWVVYTRHHRWTVSGTGDNLSVSLDT